MLKRIVAITAAAAVTSQPLAPSCSCAAGACNLTSTVEFSGCVEYSGARARTNQNCTAICASWRNAPPPTQGNLPGARISTQSTKWWSCKVPGALMLSTGNNTHCTIAYFNKAKADSSVRASSQQDIIALAMAFAKGHDGMSELDVRGSLTHMWGCGAAGGSCHPSSVLVDVASPLAQLKYGVMDALLAQGYAVDTTSWGATAHIDLASSKSATSATAAVHSASSAMTALPPRQSPSQAALFDRVSRDAKSDSASATATILAYLDTAPFRAALAECCGSVAALPATTLLARFRAEVDTMELVHNFDPRGGEFGELNLTQWLRMDYDYNLWTMAYLGNHTPSFLSNCDKAETGLMGFRPFSNVRRGSGDLPHTLAEAWERPIYTALNLWHASTGNQKFGPISIVFNRTVADELTLLLPVDSGLWEGSCNRTEEEVATPLSYNRMNCSAWQRGTPGDDPSADLHLGTFAAYDHVAATWLTSQGIWQPAYRAPIPPRLFARLFAGFITNSSAPGTGFLPNGATNLTTQEGVTGQLYWEAQIAGGILFPPHGYGVKMLVGQFDQLFGDPIVGRQLQALARQNGWILLWALGAPGASSSSSHHHWPPAPTSNATWSMEGRVVDPTTLNKSTVGHNLTASVADLTAWSAAWAAAGKMRAVQPKPPLPQPANYSNVWSALWSDTVRSLAPALRLRSLRAASCADSRQCVGVNAEGSCVCYL